MRKKGISTFQNLVVVAAEQGKFFQKKDDWFWLPTPAVQTLQQKFQVFGKGSKNLKWNLLTDPIWKENLTIPHLVTNNIF